MRKLLEEIDEAIVKGDNVEPYYKKIYYYKAIALALKGILEKMK